jgi:hypothetical protein
MRLIPILTDPHLGEQGYFQLRDTYHDGRITLAKGER